MSKKIYIIAFFIILFICLILFIYFTYKNSKLGNNIIKSDNILNISSYDATVEVEVHSNKNINKYILKQQYLSPNIFKQEVIEPENIKGISTTFDGENLIIKNKMLNLQSFYENYSIIRGNSLSLASFIEQYKESKDVEKEETSDEIIIKIKSNQNNKYKMYKKLYINKKTKIPTRMEISGFNQNMVVYILYREIIINKTSMEEILA